MSGASAPAAGQRESKSKRQVAISLLFDHRIPGLDANAVTRWLRSVLDDTTGLRPLASGDRRLELNSFDVRLVDDATMIDLNTRFRGKTTTTDVLSFPGESTAEGNHLGDVAISVPQAQRQSQEIGSSLMTELQRLLLHGVLHCLGFDHETDDGEMERVEVALRERWIDPDAPWSLTLREPR